MGHDGLLLIFGQVALSDFIEGVLLLSRGVSLFEARSFGSHYKHSCCYEFLKSGNFFRPISGVPKGGNGGSRPPIFQNVGPQDSHKNVIKLLGGIGQICQEVVSEILEKQAKTGFSGVHSKVLVSKKRLNTARGGTLSQSRMLIFKNFPGSCPQTHSFQYLLLYLSLNMPLATGIPVCCLG